MGPAAWGEPQQGRSPQHVEFRPLRGSGQVPGKGHVDHGWNVPEGNVLETASVLSGCRCQRELSRGKPTSTQPEDRGRTEAQACRGELAGRLPPRAVLGPQQVMLLQVGHRLSKKWRNSPLSHCPVTSLLQRIPSEHSVFSLLSLPFRYSGMF